LLSMHTYFCWARKITNGYHNLFLWNKFENIYPIINIFYRKIKLIPWPSSNL
jgi:hypothetical protein